MTGPRCQKRQLVKRPPLFFFNLLIICLILAVESSNTLTARAQSGALAWQW